MRESCGPRGAGVIGIQPSCEEPAGRGRRATIAACRKGAVEHSHYSMSLRDVDERMEAPNRVASVSKKRCKFSLMAAQLYAGQAVHAERGAAASVAPKIAACRDCCGLVGTACCRARAAIAQAACSAATWESCARLSSC